ncbi:MAG: T9SS type A sorting domain-containing protein [Saprospiraceae bacterium]|nr:T9SS type A sorting domain-containing protein [Saprospiraceae bacterium]
MKRTLLLLLFIIGLSTTYSQVISHQFNYRVSPDQDAHYPLFNPGRGNRVALKFDISRIPQGAEIKAAQLNVHVLYSEVNWDGDVIFYNLNNQSWDETQPADSLELSFRSDSTHQDSLFGMMQLGWHNSIDLSQIVLRDYTQKNQYCTIFMVDPDDQDSLFTAGTPLFDHDTLVCGEEMADGKMVFWSSESPDTSFRPYLAIRYCFHTDTQFSLSACDSISLNGETFYTSGQYQQVIPNSSGCDSTLTIDLTINHSSSSDLKLSGCDSIEVNGFKYFRSGNYKQIFVNHVGCDSVLNLQLTVHPSYLSQLLLSDCDSVIVNGVSYTTSGIYSQDFKSIYGCDSILEIKVVINPTTFGTITRTACDSIFINGELFDQSGIFTQVLKNSNNCDSILTINLTINHSNSELLEIEDCDSIVVNGVSFFRSGNYRQTLKNKDGCDSSLLLKLTIHKSAIDSFEYTACNGLVLNGVTYDSSGYYTQHLQTIHGCDSTLLLYITINQSTSNAISLTECDSAIINNQKYDSSGVYTQLLTNAAGCDSLLFINLTVHYSNSEVIEISDCDSVVVNGTAYYQSGIYTQSLSNTDGCDSLLIIDAMVFIADTSILVNGNKLISLDSSSLYQWVDCDNNFAPIPGDTNIIFTATKSGNYAVVLFQGGCADTSACYPVMVVATDDQNKSEMIKVYPNPTQDILILKLEKSQPNLMVRCMSISGQLQFAFQLNSEVNQKLDVSMLQPGIYILEISNHQMQNRIRFFKN